MQQIISSLLQIIEKCLHVFLVKCNKYFNYIIREGNELSFLKIRIVQSTFEISIDQSNHIQQKISNTCSKPSKVVPFQLSPFPLDSKIKMELFYSTPITKQEHAVLAQKYNGAYNAWAGVLVHVAGRSRLDLV